VYACRFKKVSAFLQYYQSVGLLAVVDNNGVITVTKVERAHSLYRAVKTTASCVATQDSESDSSASVSAFGWSKTAAITDGKITVLSLFKLTKPAKDIFGNVRGEFGEFLRGSEIRDLLRSYMTGSENDGATTEKGDP
jgi:hypothetical protein